jgi:hypothetical protein
MYIIKSELIRINFIILNNLTISYNEYKIICMRLIINNINYEERRRKQLKQEFREDFEKERSGNY